MIQFTYLGFTLFMVVMFIIAYNMGGKGKKKTGKLKIGLEEAKIKKIFYQGTDFTLKSFEQLLNQGLSGQQALEILKDASQEARQNGK